MVERHVEKLNFKCSLCNEVFADMTTFQAHMPSHAEKVQQTAKYQCDFKKDCLRFFERRHLLLRLANDHSVKDKTQLNECTHCDQVFVGRNNFELHLLKEHKIKPPKPKLPKLEITCTIDGHLRCYFCQEKFSSKEKLEEHIEVHLRTLYYFRVPFGCGSCNFFFRSYSYLTLHYAQEHDTIWPDFPYECEFCLKKFKIVTMYKYHMEGHSGIFKTCDPCGRKFSSTISLKSHIAACHGPKKYVCEVCGAAFTISVAFKNHKYSHDQKLLKCLLCDYTTCNLSHLRSHMENHFKKKKKCKICKKAVYRLRTHMQWKHSSEKQEYACKICGKMYASPISYNYHMDSVHLGRKTFQCEICAEFFRSLAILRTHRRKMHDIMPHICCSCRKGFMTPTQLKSHRAKAHRNKDD